MSVIMINFTHYFFPFMICSVLLKHGLMLNANPQSRTDTIVSILHIVAS